MIPTAPSREAGPHGGERGSGRSYGLILVAPLPPPEAGTTVATRMLVRALQEADLRHRVVDLSRPFHLGPLWLSYLRRLLDVASLPLRARRAAVSLGETHRVFYLHLGQGWAAMLRDLPLIELASTRGWPVVVHIHGAGFRDAYERGPMPLRLLVRRALGKVTRVIVLTPGLRRMVDGLVAPQRVVVVENAAERTVAERARACARAAPNQRERPLTVLYLSNLIAAKGYTTVLDAARLAHQRGLPHHFVLAGAITETTVVRPERFSQRHALPNVTYRGPVDATQKLALLEEADVVVLPSQTEGVPITILEALHFGLPVITTPVGGIPDTIEDAQHGFLVPIDDAPAIVRAIETLDSDRALLAEMSRRCRTLAGQRFTEDTHGRAMLRLFDEVARECFPGLGQAVDR